MLLVNADALGTETLKNLVLPGVGEFCICDANLVTELDLASNFFLAAEDIGVSRAMAARNNLVEMNPDVVGQYRAEDIAALLDSGERMNDCV